MGGHIHPIAPLPPPSPKHPRLLRYTCVGILHLASIHACGTSLSILSSDDILDGRLLELVFR